MQIVSLNENIKYSVHLDLSQLYIVSSIFIVSTLKIRKIIFLRFEIFEYAGSENSPSVNITDFIE